MNIRTKYRPSTVSDLVFANTYVRQLVDDYANGAKSTAVGCRYPVEQDNLAIFKFDFVSV